jgi:uncharacterized repeat protein (TIGR03837 family)
MRGMRWDLFCRVIDNYGDIGVCWRLAADLAGRGQVVRLWVDDPTALGWMAPQGCQGVEVRPWREHWDPVEPADVVVEAFGCDPPDPYIECMAKRSPPPVWINLEYLSAEDYVERSHGLPSPRWHSPGVGLVKRFFYPGFTPRTGGLLREPGLLARRAAFDGLAWLARQGLAPRAHERVVSLFCYDNPRLSVWLEGLAERPTLLLVTPGQAARQVAAVLGRHPREGDTEGVGALRLHWLPPLTQTEFDHLLWACDLNVVRGEDSFVRAQWAARPFLWHIYPQGDGAHAPKLEAFLDRYLEGVAPGTAQALRALWRAWNGLSGDLRSLHPSAWPEPTAWRAHAGRWCEALAGQVDLCTQLLDLAQTPRAHSG